MKKRIIYGGILASALLSFPPTLLVASGSYSDAHPPVPTNSDAHPPVPTNSDAHPPVPTNSDKNVPTPLPPPTDAIVNGEEHHKKADEETPKKVYEETHRTADPVIVEPPNVYHRRHEKSGRN